MSSNGEFMGVLLAAGKGSRMGALSEYFPKPILPIANKPLLVHQVELLARLGITEIVVLIGYKGYEITKVLGDGSRYGVQLHYVEQTQMLGIAHALGQLEAIIDRPFLLFLGDIYFVPKDIAAMLTAHRDQSGGAVLATKFETDPKAIMRNFSVVEQDGRVLRVIEKPRHVTNQVKGVGLYCFDLSIFDAIRRTHRTAMRDEYEITEAIQVLIDDGEYVTTVNAVHDDINMTFPDDLLELNVALAKQSETGNLIHPDAKISGDAKLNNCVIGLGAQIEGAIEMSNCLVFDKVKVSGKKQLQNMIVMSNRTLACQVELGVDA